MNFDRQQFGFNATTKVLLSLVVLVCAIVSSVFADDPEIKNKDPFGINSVPRATQGTGVEPQIGTIIDPDIHFHDHDNRFVGVIGVIGPTRLNYARIVPMVDYTASVIGKLISSGS